VAIQPDQRREQLFTDRYERLLACALRLTNQLRDAEDLVHDAFVQWVLSRTRLEEIENIDGYLRRMLRYMHLSRISRSAQHLHETALSVADYDSFRLGWTAIEPPRRMQASQELHQICAYACSRKESSRAGSVLILRFFHDYFPVEIAGILNSSRPCVDQWQRLARREAKLSMNKPGQLRFVSADAPAERHPVRYLRSEYDLMFDLRQMIFNSCRGDCLSQFELKEIYSEHHGEALTTRKLAHIVSCARCLDAVNGLLGLPLLAARYHGAPSESEDPPHDKTGGGTTGGGSTDLTKRLAHKIREIHEHKPHELRIAVNGFLVSSLKVSADSSELNLNLTPDEPAEFVEICSEQGLQLLFFSVDPGGPRCEQWACIELSEGRSLEACFRNESGPSLHVVYRDPVAAEAHVSNDMLHQNFLSSPLSVVSNQRKIERKGFHLEIWKIFGRLARSLDGQIREASFLTVLGQSHHVRRKHAWFSLMTGLIAAAVVAGFLFFKVSLEPAMTATVLLERAGVAERMRDEVPNRVRHRLIDLEERHGAGETIVAKQKIEIWESRANGRRSQRLYDGSNRMIAGVWQTAGGSRTIYHHGSKPQSQPSLASPDSLLPNLEDIWQLEPSIHGFSFIAEPNITGVEERATSYVLHYEKERTFGASRLLKAMLTLNKSDLHPVEQILLVQRGSELREYRFVEKSFELVPIQAVAPTVFEIEPELAGGTGETGRPENGAFRNLESSRVPLSVVTSNPPAASAELEVDVAY
jgi:DNA-directed RNA polymerase specialized sigma24 family protein